MSTPTRRPLYPTELADPPYQTPALSGSGQPADESAVLRSSKVSIPAREQAETEWGSRADPGDDDPLLSPYAPKHARARSAQRPDGLSAHGAIDLPDDTASLQPAHQSPMREQPAPRLDEGDPDLERLEASLRWLQRQEAATRPTRPAPAFERHAAARYPHQERAGFRSPPLPEPEFMPPPPSGASGRPWRWLLLTLIGAGAAAPMLYYFASDRLGPAFESAPSQLARSTRGSEAPRSIRRDEAAPIASRDDESGTSIVPPTSFRRANTLPALPAGPSSAVESAAPPPSAAGDAKAAPPSSPVRVLDPEQIALLVKQGEQLVAAGDLVAARVVFQRAAESGDVAAAVALAATYDPTVLARLGVVGIDGDVEKARSWYRKAESMGSAEATRRLRILAKQ
jgi:hypothetical protein